MWFWDNNRKLIQYRIGVPDGMTLMETHSIYVDTKRAVGMATYQGAVPSWFWAYFGEESNELVIAARKCGGLTVMEMMEMAEKVTPLPEAGGIEISGGVDGDRLLQMFRLCDRVYCEGSIVVYPRDNMSRMQLEMML